MINISDIHDGNTIQADLQPSRSVTWEELEEDNRNQLYMSVDPIWKINQLWLFCYL